MAQRLFLDIAGTQLEPQDTELLRHPEICGLILFSRNYESPSQLRELIKSVRLISPEILIGVDQEGGRVQRFIQGFERLPSLQAIAYFCRDYPEQATEACFHLGWLMAAELMTYDIDISFAPVLDLDDHSCAAIGDRSFSVNPDEAISLAKSYLLGMAEAGMAATAKHFPGHGSVREDSHLALPEDARSLKQVRQNDLRPFVELAAYYQAVMPGHLLFSAIDPYPVGFSRFWLQQLLRTEMDFGGTVFSDDLSMQGAAESGSYKDRARLALDAGCDLLLACNNRQGTMQILDFLESYPGNSIVAKQHMLPNRSWTREEFLSHQNYKKAKNYLDKIKGIDE